MKKLYVRPEMAAEEFLANSYVAACGDSGTIYKFNCNISSFNTLWEETNGIPGLQTEDKKTLTCTNTNRWHNHTNTCYTYTQHADTKVISKYGLYGCNTKHEAESTSDFANGYVTGGSYSSATPVIIWYSGTDHSSTKNVHVTKDLDMSSWETVKS